jgi:hypothetical protein
VRDVVRDVVAEVEPQELPLVDALFEFDDVTVIRRLHGRGRRPDPLGFGVGEVVALATPVVWLAVNQLAGKLADSAVDAAAKRTTTVLRRVFRRPAAPATVPPLTREQVGEVRRLVLEVAAQRGVSTRRATELADAVAVRLALNELAAGPLDGSPEAG